MFSYLGCRTVATFPSSLWNLLLSDGSRFGFLNWSFWRILFLAALGKWLHTIVILLYCYLAFIIFLKVFSHRDKLFHTSFHYRNYFLPSFLLPKSFLPLRLYLSFFPLSAPAEEVVNSFIFHVKFTACSQMLSKNIASLFRVLVCEFYDSIFL